MILDLDPPIEFSGKQTSSLELREPTVAEYMKAQAESKGDSVKLLVHLIAAVSDSNRQIIEKLPMSTFIKAGDFVQSFLSPQSSSVE